MELGLWSVRATPPVPRSAMRETSERDVVRRLCRLLAKTARLDEVDWQELVEEEAIGAEGFEDVRPVGGEHPAPVGGQRRSRRRRRAPHLVLALDEVRGEA